jgi:hypothetical protein
LLDRSGIVDGDEANGLAREANPVWLWVILDCLSAERKLEGVDAPPRRELPNLNDPAEAQMVLETFLPYVKRALATIDQRGDEGLPQ